MHTCTISGKSYIGKTDKGIHFRLRTHISEARRGKSNSHFHNAILRYGVESFNSVVLYISFENDSKHLYDVEAKLISDYSTFYTGYNLTPGGLGTGSGRDHPKWGTKQSSETKAKISAAQSGEKNHNYGKKATLETRRKQSVAHSGENNAAWGKSLPESRKAKISASLMGKKHIRYDHAIYYFRHVSGLEFVGTRNDLQLKYKLSSSGVSLFISGKYNSTKGWNFYKIIKKPR